MKRLVTVACALGLLAGGVWQASAGSKHPWKPTKAQVDAAKTIGKAVTITNSIGMKFVLIPAGSFMMGTPANKITATPDSVGSTPDEAPEHRVVISRPFYLQTTEVTQAQYRAIMGKNPSKFKGCDRCPVERVSWHDAREFIRRLNAREKTNKYRLPSEAEWEYATRAGTTTRYNCGDSPECLKDSEWNDSTSGGQTNPVGIRIPNPWGLYDMHGNVAEWCSDWYAKDFYKKSPLTDPQGPASGRKKVLRGGSYGDPPREVYSATRGSWGPSGRRDSWGFRVVRVAP